ncbi:MAG: amino acid ABC transporter substrate-binding protein [Burkholderiales bacterium]|nr:amino acid ABC transporter substrate-binding protein [Burkholderiales bacterium]
MKTPTTTFSLLATLGIALMTTSAAHALDATMTRIKKTGTIVMGHRDAAVPFSYVDAGVVKGYSIDLCTAVADTVRRDLGLKDLRIKWVAVDAKTRFSAVRSGKIDIECGVTTNTLGRQKEVDFSPMIFVDGANILVKNESSIKSVLDLSGKSVAVAGGTTTENALKVGFERRKIDGRVVVVRDHVDGIAALMAGKVDAYAADQSVLIGLALATGGGNALRMPAEQFTYEPYGLMFRRGQVDFRVSVTRALAQTYRSPQLPELFSRWFSALGGKPSPLLETMFILNGLAD